MHLVSCTNTHHDVADFADLGMVKNLKTWISWEQRITFPRNKKFIIFKGISLKQSKGKGKGPTRL